MYNTEIIRTLALRVQIALPLRQDLNIIKYDYLQTYICINYACSN